MRTETGLGEKTRHILAVARKRGFCAVSSNDDLWRVAMKLVEKGLARMEEQAGHFVLDDGKRWEVWVRRAKIYRTKRKLKTMPKKSKVQYAPLFNHAEPRVVRLKQGRGRRDLERFDTFEEAHQCLIQKAEDNLKAAKILIVKAKKQKGACHH